MSAVVSVTLAVAVITNFPAVSRTADDDTQIAKSLATLLRAGRTVISRNQDRINDPNVGNKGIDAKMVLAEASKLYQQTAEIDPSAIPPNSLQGKLVHMQMDAIAEVMDVHQETINRQGVGFKGFIPAVFGRLVNEAFGRRAAGVAEMKVTAPPRLIRNPKVRPDEWELEAIQTRLMASSWPKDQPYTATAVKERCRRRSVRCFQNITAAAAFRATAPLREKSTLPASRKKAPAKVTWAELSASRCTDKRTA